MVSFEIPSRLSLCFQNEIGLSFRKLKSYYDFTIYGINTS